MIKLRDYQRECLDAIKDNSANGCSRQLVSLPTGAGKTVIFSHLIRETGCKALVLAHTGELLQQAKEKIEMVCPGLEVGIVNGESKEFDKPVVVSSIQALYRPQNLEQLISREFGLLIYDEAHHAAADMAREVLQTLGFGPGAQRLLVGFSATPSRQDGRGLGEIFDKVVYEKDIRWMIEAGYLCRPRGLKVALDLDLSKVKSADGDFLASSLAEVMDTPEIIRHVVDAYLLHAADLPTICFATSIQHSENLAEAFRQAGVVAASISGEIPKEERGDLLERYKRGEITVLTNCQVLTEGFDAPETSCIIVARPTKSAALFQQMTGRGLRLFPNKRECLILDFGDRTHSLCSVAMLLGDREYLRQKEVEEEAEAQKKGALSKIPPRLNKKLKAAIINFDPLGNDFVWQKEGNTYTLKGSGKVKLEILAQEEERFAVVLAADSEGLKQKIVDNLSFEYAFAAAEDWARKNRHLFVINDQGAPWRAEPISEKQIAIFRSHGYSAGIEQLTKGQASILIGSGCLKKAS